MCHSFPGFWWQKVEKDSLGEKGGWFMCQFYNMEEEGAETHSWKARYLSAEDFQNNYCWLSNNILLWVPELHKLIQDLPQIRRKWVFHFQRMCTGYLGCCHAYISILSPAMTQSRRMAHISLIPPVLVWTAGKISLWTAVIDTYPPMA